MADKRFSENYAILAEASHLLHDDNLIWSDDLELIRKPLAAWLMESARYAQHADKNALKLAKLLISSETNNDGLASLSWLDEWKKNKWVF